MDDPIAVELRGFGPLGLLAIAAILAGNLIFVPLSALLVLVWAERSRTPWRAIGYVRPGSWARTIAGGIALGVVLRFLMTSLVMPLLGADPANSPYRYLEGNRAALPGVLFALTAGAGFGEETVFRGYLFERFGALLGPRAWAPAAIVAVTSAWFGLVHYPEQGIAGAEQAAMVGLIFGTIVAVTGRIWLVMCAHAVFDLAALAAIYWGVQSNVAHLVFK